MSIPCHLIVSGDFRRGELTFVPSRNITKLGLRSYMMNDETSLLLIDSEIEDSQVIAGVQVNIASAVRFGKRMAEQEAYMKIEIYDWDTEQIEICVEALFVFLPAAEKIDE